VVEVDRAPGRVLALGAGVGRALVGERVVSDIEDPRGVVGALKERSEREK